MIHKQFKTILSGRKLKKKNILDIFTPNFTLIWDFNCDFIVKIFYKIDYIFIVDILTYNFNVVEGKYSAE